MYRRRPGGVILPAAFPFLIWGAILMDATSSPATVTKRNSSSVLPSDWHDRLFRGITRLFAYAVLAIVVAILISLLVEALPALRKFGFGFLTSTECNRG